MRRRRFETNRDFYLVVGQRIAKARAGKLTQEQLAKRASLTRTSIINIEKGRQQVLLHTVVEIAKALQVPLINLIPELDSVELVLRDKPRALEWVISATTRSDR